jgi:hypothetical protein
MDVFQMTRKVMIKRLLIALLIVVAILIMPAMAGCRLSVDSDPQGAMIYFDGEYTGYETPHEFDPVLMPPAPITEIKLVHIECYDWLLSEQAPNFGFVCRPDCYQNPGTCEVSIYAFLTPKPYIATPTPEFPSAFLPATMIIGFLGAVLLIQRTREH